MIIIIVIQILWLHGTSILQITITFRYIKPEIKFTFALIETRTQGYTAAKETILLIMRYLGRIKKQSCFSSPPSLLGAASLFFFFFFYKNADNALQIELKRSKIEMPLSF